MRKGSVIKQEQDEHQNNANTGKSGSSPNKFSFRGILDKILEDKAKHRFHNFGGMESEENTESVVSPTFNKSSKDNDTLKLLEVHEIKHKNSNQNKDQNKGFLKQSKRAINYYLNKSVHRAPNFRIPEISSVTSRNHKGLLHRRSQVIEKNSFENLLITPVQQTTSCNDHSLSTSLPNINMLTSRKRLNTEIDNCWSLNTKTTNSQYKSKSSLDEKDMINSYRKIKFIGKRQTQKQPKLTSRVYAVDEIHDLFQ